MQLAHYFFLPFNILAQHFMTQADHPNASPYHPVMYYTVCCTHLHIPNNSRSIFLLHPAPLSVASYFSRLFSLQSQPFLLTYCKKIYQPKFTRFPLLDFAHNSRNIIYHQAKVKAVSEITIS